MQWRGQFSYFTYFTVHVGSDINNQSIGYSARTITACTRPDARPVSGEDLKAERIAASYLNRISLVFEHTFNGCLRPVFPCGECEGEMGKRCTAARQRLALTHESCSNGIITG